jgi:hypothetical protein
MALQKVRLRGVFGVAGPVLSRLERAGGRVGNQLSMIGADDRGPEGIWMVIRGTQPELHVTAILAAIPAARASSLLGGLLLLTCP